ncbi:hypothetical protein GJ744_001387 [Endocarpon pusillum]|uniref:Uncharacterized protein n=1 Tax=Endocarpon pusillum TaxID=364733 RepID=A0A8H7AT30_9EURO|nr:hypothetical protein GJ744_001387 [Endocarpon pusillum]
MHEACCNTLAKADWQQSLLILCPPSDDMLGCLLNHYENTGNANVVETNYGVNVWASNIKTANDECQSLQPSFLVLSLLLKLLVDPRRHSKEGP